MPPDQEPIHGNCQRGGSHEPVAEDLLPGKGGDHFADDAHRRKDHNIDGRVGIKPEQVLEEERIAAMLELAGLSDRAGDKVGTFSKGMRQRLALGRAMLHDPDLLILDEPTAGVDARILWTVTIKLRPVRIEEKPVMKIPTIAGTTRVLE